MTQTSEFSNQSPKSPKCVESDKTKRYDRQLRLWGDCGQIALESSHVCLINATTVGTEILKSLVLPGIGSFTIVDHNLVTEEDLGTNFFLLDDDTIGKSRARIATQLLLEMNGDVNGEYIEESLDSLLESNDQFFKRFSVVIATAVYNEKSLIKLTQHLWHLNVPLVVCKSIGFIGYIRVQVREHPIIESHPENICEDLRLDKPFDELKTYFDSYEKFEEMSRKELAHTPYLVVLHKFIQKWRTEYGKNSNDLPNNYKEKQQLKDLIKSGSHLLRTSVANSDDELKELDLENFEEAIKSVNSVLCESSFIPSETKQILDDPSVSSPLATNSFWLCVKALKEFVTRYHCLPLRGTIPDMISDTKKYVELLKIYSAKAKEDAETVYNICQTISKAPNVNVTENDVKLFCKNAHNLNVVRTSSFDSELTGEALRELVSSAQFVDDGCDELIYYLLLRSVDRFFSLHNRFPGQFDDHLESDVSQLKTYLKEILTDLGSISLAKDDFIHEICRYGGCELHTIAAFVGGCAAQEVIKLVTSQYIPINNTFIYNGLTSNTVTYKL